MAHVKIYGNRSVWGERRTEVSDAVHAAVVRSWGLPEDKRFHRFLLLDDGDLVAPRSAAYLVIEILCFTGRSVAAKKALVRAMYDDVAPALGLSPDDLEVVVVESPRENWGIRGRSADELSLGYRVEV
ncbi:tautomerase family protein [Isoptericola sp. S6320L]|uniref:tautomerase family protein n=1 Tax=Isoptericola sp. S6320L TaxID=2926411 RepID=UPI001FF24999|nr:tautomerase family protein [Isoptericola sp. S6320L]MCK0118575.1 tautomerase family protein [Isoptericola sp. S6320L]